MCRLSCIGLGKGVEGDELHCETSEEFERHTSPLVASSSSFRRRAHTHFQGILTRVLLQPGSLKASEGFLQPCPPAEGRHMPDSRVTYDLTCLARGRVGASVQAPKSTVTVCLWCVRPASCAAVDRRPRALGMMAVQWRDSASLRVKLLGDISPCSGGKNSRHVHHVLLLVVVALVSLAALFTAVSTTRGVSGRSSLAEPGGVSAADVERERSQLPSRPGHGSIGNDSTLLAFVMSEPDAEHEKNMIKEVLESSDLDSHRRQRGRAASRPSRLPSPRYAPFWPQFRALLRARAAMKRYDPKVMQSLVATIKEPIERHRQHRHQLSKSLPRGLRPAAPTSSVAALQYQQERRYASCAVVGNSGILLNTTYGKAIDAHEAVVRLNNARAKGFEKHVGRKTTIAFMNSNILHKCARRVGCYCHVYGGGTTVNGENDDDDVAIVMYISQVQHIMDMATCGPVHAAPLMVTDPRFDALTARIAKWYSVREFVERTGKGVSEWPWGASYSGVQGFHYSSGMQAVMLALGICEEVDLYGFGKANGTKHHYHTAQPAELHIHDYAAEYIFYDELATPISRNAIPFLRDAGIRLPTVRVFGCGRQVVVVSR